MTEFLYQKLEEIDEQEGLYTEGDALLFQFYCGNWSASVQRNHDQYVYNYELDELTPLDTEERFTIEGK